MKEWGLALGAGGIFGFAHVGVLQALEYYGLKPSFIAGTSAGAVAAALWASAESSTDFMTMAYDIFTGDGEVNQYLTALTANEAPLNDLPSALAGGGLIDGNWIQSVLDRITKGKMLTDIRIPISIVSCDLISGNTVVFTNTSTDAIQNGDLKRSYVYSASLSTAVRASLSLPGIFKPKEFEGYSLIDGGIKEMVPAFEVLRMGAQRVLAVDLGSHIDREQKVKGVYSILTRSFNLASRKQTIADLRRFASLTIWPETWSISLPVLPELKKLIDSGKRCTEENIYRWLDIIS